MTIKEVGCCGAYCRTCMDWQKRKYPNQRGCLGCKLGYEMGKRDLSKARCEIKVCCFRDRKLETCADCPNYPCIILTAFWSKKGSKYQQYKKQLEYIKQHGYEEYLKKASKWTRAAGRLDSP